MNLKQQHLYKKLCHFTIMVIAACALSSCATKPEKYLVVHTKMNKSIWLPSTPKSQKTIYLNINNRTDDHAISLNEIRHRLAAKGYTVYTRPNQSAYYQLQVNIVKIGRTSASASKIASDSTHLSDIGTPLKAGSLKKKQANHVENDMTYAGVADILITVQHKNRAAESYSRRVVATASKKHLTFDRAVPIIQSLLVIAISDIF